MRLKGVECDVPCTKELLLFSLQSSLLASPERSRCDRSGHEGAVT